MSFRNEKFPPYKATRDNRTKVELHTFKVEGGWSAVVVDTKRPEPLGSFHIPDHNHSQDSFNVLYYGVLALCTQKQLKPTRHEHSADGEKTVRRLG